MSVIQQSWNDNLITLNQARIGLGYPPDANYGYRYKFELFPSQADGIKSMEADQHQSDLVQIQDRQQPIFAQKWMAFWEEEREAALNLIFPQKKSLSEKAPQMAEELNRRLDIAERKLAALYRRQAEEVFYQSGKRSESMVDAPGQLTRKQAKEEVNVLASQFAQRTLKDFKEDLQELFETATSGGWTLTRFRKELMNRYQSAIQKAEMVSTTELSKVSNAGARAGYKAKGVLALKWHSEPGACSFCKEMSRRVTRIDQPFLRVGDQVQFQGERKVRKMVVKHEAIQHPPLHPRCRCSIVPAVNLIGLMNQSFRNDDTFEKPQPIPYDQVDIEEWKDLPLDAYSPRKEFFMAVQERIQQGMEDYVDALELGDILFQERQRWIKAVGLDRIEASIKEWERIKEAETSPLKKWEIDTKLDPAKKIWMDKSRELHFRLLWSVRDVGFPEKKQPLKMIQDHEIPPSSERFRPRPLEDIEEYLDEIQFFYPKDWWKNSLKDTIYPMVSEAIPNFAGYLDVLKAAPSGLPGSVLVLPMDTTGPRFKPGKKQIPIHHVKHSLLHELGHRMEYTNPKVRDVAFDFLDWRNSADPDGPRRLIDVLREMNLDLPPSDQADTRVIKDHWVHPYVGVVYGDRGSTEVITTGMEYLFGYRYRMKMMYDLSKDEVHQKFVWGVLAGFGREG